jgi:hypothetical protein
MVQNTKTGGNIPKNLKITKCTKIYQMAVGKLFHMDTKIPELSIPRLFEYTQIEIFGVKINHHLATPNITCMRGGERIFFLLQKENKF